MKIQIKKSKLSNLYSFISNLSQWNELACVPQRKKEWVKITGKLSNGENLALKKFSKIFQEAEENIELYFLFQPESSWNILLKKIGKKKTEDLRHIFDIFKKRFEIIWENDLKKINTIENYFLNKKDINNKIEIIEKLTGIKNKNEKIELRLLLSSNSKEDCQGWAYKESVILECSGWPLNQLDFLSDNIFLHELFHILFKKNKKLFRMFKEMVASEKNALEKNILSNWPPEIIFEESLVSSFLPEGYLSEKFSGMPAKKIAEKELQENKDGFTKLRNYCALNLYDISKDYSENKKTIDLNYLQKVFSATFNFLKRKE